MNELREILANPNGLSADARAIIKVLTACCDPGIDVDIVPRKYVQSGGVFNFGPREDLLGIIFQTGNNTGNVTIYIDGQVAFTLTPNESETAFWNMSSKNRICSSFSWVFSNVGGGEFIVLYTLQRKYRSI